MSDGLDISGGATGMAAALADVRRHAGLLGAAADDLLGIGRDIAAVAVAADLGEAALLCPDVVAEVEQRLTAATLSPAEGVLVVGSELGVLGGAAAWCAQTYERVDAEVAASLDHAVHVGGFAAGWAAPLALAPLVAALSAAVAAEPRLGHLLARYAASGAASDDLDSLLATHPFLLDALLRAAPWLVEGAAVQGAGAAGITGPVLLRQLTGGRWVSGRYEEIVGGLGEVARHSGRLTDSGRFAVATTPTAVSPPVRLDPSAPVGGLLRHQAWMDSWFPDDTPPGQTPAKAAAGQIAIVTVTADNGSRTYVIHVPGTETWDPSRGNNPIDLTTNVELMAQHEAQMTGLVAAAIRTHVPAGAPVLLVGHSQGGITAASVAADPALRTAFEIRGVVTVGSPIARFPLDPATSVLSIEHTQDVVPLLDGAANPDQPGWVTVRRDLTQAGGVIGCTAQTLEGSHDLTAYQATALAVDASDDPALVAWREANAVFFTGTAQARQYAIEPVS